MGQFSWFTQDSNKRIVNGRKFNVIMTDDKGNQYKECCYGGYGVFGGKDYYVLLAEMNGFSLSDFEGTPEQRFDKLRSKGINLAFEGHPMGDNPNVKHPSITESGKYMGGVAPESDPNQGFVDLYNDDEWEDEENERWLEEHGFCDLFN